MNSFEQKSYKKINVLESDQFLGVSNRATKSVLRRLIAQKNVQEMFLKVINSWGNVLESGQFLGVSNRATKSVLRRLIAQKNVQEMLSKVINSWEMFLKAVNSWVCLIELLNPFSGG